MATLVVSTTDGYLHCAYFIFEGVLVGWLLLGALRGMVICWFVLSALCLFPACFNCNHILLLDSRTYVTRVVGLENMFG